MKTYQVDYTQHKMIKNSMKRDRAAFALNFVMFVFGAAMFFLCLFLWSFL